MISLFHTAAAGCSAFVTNTYSTSFSSAIRLLHKDFHAPIHGVYGFVRLADEIVDSFHDYDKAKLLKEFSESTYKALDDGISLNPILHSFQRTVREYNIPKDLIAAFLYSMEMDLEKKTYQNNAELDNYIYGSAEVVGLMCLCIFLEGDQVEYERLKPSAKKLGAAFQKVNFLRDLQADYKDLERSYFPNFDALNFDESQKREIESSIKSDFDDAMWGIKALPPKARFGVFAAYKYYNALFKKITQLQPQAVMKQRVRVPDFAKLMIVLRAKVEYRMGLV